MREFTSRKNNWSLPSDEPEPLPSNVSDRLELSFEGAVSFVVVVSLAAVVVPMIVLVGGLLKLAFVKEIFQSGFQSCFLF